MENDNDRKHLIMQIKDELMGLSTVKSRDDNLEETVQQESFCNNYEYQRRNKLYSDLLDSYISIYIVKCRTNRLFKLVFFWLTISVFVIVILSMILAMIIVASKQCKDTSDVVLAISSLSGMLGTIIVLPRIIGNYLFPNDEDENMNGMLKSMQSNDLSIRNICASVEDEFKGK